jgi:hypothetical protein
MTRVTVRFLSLLLPLGIAACANSGGYPSLALRDVERASETGAATSGAAKPGGSAAAAPGDQAPAIPALPPASADLVTRLATLVKIAQDADRQFQANRPAAERAIAASGAVGSDSWSSASIALGTLESSRSSGMSALAQLDTLYADARDVAPVEESPSATAIGAARTQVAALIDAQDAALATLSGRLKG